MRLKHKYFFLILILVNIFFILIDLNIGSYTSNPFEFIPKLFDASDSTTLQILLNIRLPHVICAIICGMSLSLVSCILQSILSNPLASPSTVGISQGSACGAALAIVVFGSTMLSGNIWITFIFAFFFALIPSFIMFILSKFRYLNPTVIILCGVSMSVFFGGIITLIEYFSDPSKVSDILFWMFGSLRNVSWSQLLLMFCVLVFAFIYSLANYLKLNAFEAGDDVAFSSGVNILKKRVTFLIVSAICAGTITAFCGTINFIGLISPHIVRKFLDNNYKYLIPASVLCGSSLVVIADILSSIILAGAILPIGAITSFIGAPVFIYILIKMNNYATN